MSGCVDDELMAFPFWYSLFYIKKFSKFELGSQAIFKNKKRKTGVLRLLAFLGLGQAMAIKNG